VNPKTRMRSSARVGVGGRVAASQKFPPMISTQVSHHINAPRDAVYQALLDATSVATWMVPDGMTSEVHVFDPCEGGVFRISLTYDPPTLIGKTSLQTDTFHGLFVKLMPDEQVVQLVEFETFDPEMFGEMRITLTLTDSESGGTELHAVHDNLPPGLSPWDNEAGWRTSLAKLASLVERAVQHA
ncbi:MAG TPA: SRPBCC family protein, partial [Opitutaceae bacterium]